MDKTLKITLKTVINAKLPTCEGKGAFTDDDDTYRKRKQPTEVGTRRGVEEVVGVFP